MLDHDGLNVSSWAVANAIVDVLDFDIAVLNLSLCCATAKFDGYARWSGTSFAAANVSGAVAALVEPGHRNG
ncbi:S8 family serine peptidase [Pseudofrankia sp. DC12]|uniref:S8 family serine peptidase n=1 Tax=Pseudofrankia sp. DC12 TaxID=683315 RepID=UPI0005F85BFD|nr:S8 family serine peptidase [Pseudofrankia sp. DC12]